MAKYSISNAGIVDRRLVGISAMAKLKTAIDLMINTSVGTMPVIEDGKLVGVLDERPLLEYARKNEHALSASIVGEVMSKPFFITADTSIDEAIDYIISHRVSRVPIINTRQDMRCIGIVSATDILNLKIKEKK